MNKKLLFVLIVVLVVIETSVNVLLSSMVNKGLICKKRVTFVDKYNPQKGFYSISDVVGSVKTLKIETYQSNKV